MTKSSLEAPSQATATMIEAANEAVTPGMSSRQAGAVCSDMLLELLVEKNVPGAEAIAMGLQRFRNQAADPEAVSLLSMAKVYHRVAGERPSQKDRWLELEVMSQTVSAAGDAISRSLIGRHPDASTSLIAKARGFASELKDGHHQQVLGSVLSEICELQQIPEPLI